MYCKKECIAMLLAGGQGSRLYDLTKKIAKPAVSFGGKYKRPCRRGGALRGWRSLPSVFKRIAKLALRRAEMRRGNNGTARKNTCADRKRAKHASLCKRGASAVEPEKRPVSAFCGIG